MQEYYKILNVSQDATDEEIEKSYNELKEKYSRDRFLDGEEGNVAARNLTKLETAYHEILEIRKNKNSTSDNFSNDYGMVEKLIKEGKISSAQEALDACNERDAEWHYLQSVVFYKKNWINESKKQLELAMNLDPHNNKYSESYTKLKLKIEYNDKKFQSGNVGGAGGYNEQPRQMGGTDNSCLTFCATWCCVDMLCSCCCR